MSRRNLSTAGVLAILALASCATPAAALQNGLARTPPMGWNSWYTAHCGVTEDIVLRNAQALVDTGMAKLGYSYVNVDGCWEAKKRDANGRLRCDRKRCPRGLSYLGGVIYGL